MNFQKRKFLQMSTEDLILGGYVTGSTTRALNFLRKTDIKTVGDITKFTKNDIQKFRYVGPSAINQLEKVLESQGLRFRNEGEVIPNIVYMNTYERYLERTEKHTDFQMDSNESILIGTFNILQSDGLLGELWSKKTPHEKNRCMEDILDHFETWKKLTEPSLK